MRVPNWLIVAAAVVAALPFGWGLGVFVAYLIAGPDFGQLPAGTVPVCIIASIAFAFAPWLKPVARLAILLAGTGLFLLFA